MPPIQKKSTKHVGPSKKHVHTLGWMILPAEPVSNRRVRCCTQPVRLPPLSCKEHIGDLLVDHRIDQHPPYLDVDPDNNMWILLRDLDPERSSHHLDFVDTMDLETLLAAIVPEDDDLDDNTWIPRDYNCYNPPPSPDMYDFIDTVSIVSLLEDIGGVEGILC